MSEREGPPPKSGTSNDEIPQSLRDLLRDNGMFSQTSSEGTATADKKGDEHGVTMQFADEAIDALVDLSIAKDKTIRALCEENFRDYPHGLGLLARTSGSAVFTITRAMVEAPDAELSRLIVAAMRPATGV